MKRRNTALIAASVFGLTICIASPASASEPSTSVETETLVQPMSISGYDVATAEANGFEIVTYADGSQESIPITDEAKIYAADFDAASAALTLARDTVRGDCGSSSVSALKRSGDVVAFTTGFTVTGAVASRTWSVTAFSIWNTASVGLSGGPSGATWAGEGALGPLVGPGIASVPTTSRAILTNGAICRSLGPTASFG